MSIVAPSGKCSAQHPHLPLGGLHAPSNSRRRRCTTLPQALQPPAQTYGGLEVQVDLLCMPGAHRCQPTAKVLLVGTAVAAGIAPPLPDDARMHALRGRRGGPSHLQHERWMFIQHACRPPPRNMTPSLVSMPMDPMHLYVAHAYTPLPSAFTTSSSQHPPQTSCSFNTDPHNIPSALDLTAAH